MAQVTAISEMTLKCYYIHGVVEYIDVGCEFDKTATQVVSVNTWADTLYSLDEPDFIHLANYFNCSLLMEKFERQGIEIVKVASIRRCGAAIWSLLFLSYRYRWKDLKTACLAYCVKDKKCGSRSGWKEMYVSFPPELLSELFSRGFDR